MLGILTEVTFQIDRSYNLREIQTPSSYTHCVENFQSLVRSGEHVKLWIELFSETCTIIESSKTHEEPRDNPNWLIKSLEVSFAIACLFQQKRECTDC